jgi:hypothetical protein
MQGSEYTLDCWELHTWQRYRQSGAEDPKEDDVVDLHIDLMIGLSMILVTGCIGFGLR